MPPKRMIIPLSAPVFEYMPNIYMFHTSATTTQFCFLLIGQCAWINVSKCMRVPSMLYIWLGLCTKFVLGCERQSQTIGWNKNVWVRYNECFTEQLTKQATSTWNTEFYWYERNLTFCLCSDLQYRVWHKEHENENEKVRKIKTNYWRLMISKLVFQPLFSLC